MVKKEEKEIEADQVEQVVKLLHLARKAGKLQFGFDACERLCFAQKAEMLIIASDLQDNTYQKVNKMAVDSNTPVFRLSTKTELGREFRIRDVGVICLYDRNFSDGIKRIINREV